MYLTLCERFALGHRIANIHLAPKSGEPCLKYINNYFSLVVRTRMILDLVASYVYGLISYYAYNQEIIAYRHSTKSTRIHSLLLGRESYEYVLLGWNSYLCTLGEALMISARGEYWQYGQYSGRGCSRSETQGREHSTSQLICKTESVQYTFLCV